VIVFREATEDERRGVVRSQWINRVMPRRDGRDDGPHGVPFGKRETSVSRRTATRMVELFVDDRLASSDVRVLVAESDKTPGEVMGWCAYEADEVLYVCVPSGYGRTKIGTHLLRRAGANLPASWSTPNGRALLRAVRGEEKAA
jgi:hypothetical protein